MQNGQVSGPGGVRALLARHDFHTKKQYGQNFLIDHHVLAMIADAVGADENTIAFEVGPGAGALTAELASRAHRVVAIEKDETLRGVLKDALGAYDNVDVVFGDCLDIDLEKLLMPHLDDHHPLVFAANLPYYITTPILFRVLESSLPISRAVVMVQREVADRMVAGPGSKAYGVLSVGVQYRAFAKRLFTVPPSAFMPQPGVDSAVVLLDCTRPADIQVEDEPVFFSVVRAAFSTRRKTLLNALTNGLGMPKEDCRAWIERCDLSPGVRAEQLPIAAFAALARALSGIRNNPVVDS